MFWTGGLTAGHLRRTLPSWALLCAICALPFPTRAAPQAPAGPASKDILLLYSYGHGGRGVGIFDEGFLTAISAAGVGANNLHFEFLDLGRTQEDREHASLVREMLLRKYAGREVGLIVTVQQPALQFLLSDGEGIAPGAPAITVQAPMPTAEEAGAAGRRFLCQVAKFDVTGTLERALELFPGTRRVVFVAGSSEADKKMETAALSAASRWKGRLEFETTSDLALEKMLERVAHLPKDTVILFTQYNRDPKGRVTLAYEVEGRITKVANAPVFGLYDFNLGNGGIGGSVIGVRALGEKTARLALEILSGRRALTQPVAAERNDAVPLFDWAQIERWGGDVSRLPRGSLFLNRKPTFWEQYWDYVTLALALLLLQSGLIGGLLVQRRRREKAERALREAARFNEQVLASVQEGIIVYGPDLRYQLWNPHMEAISGKAASAVLGRLPQEVFPFLREGGVLERIEGALAGKPQEPVEFPYHVAETRKSGWTVDTSGPLYTSTGEIIGVIGFVRDVTEWHTARQALEESEERYRTLFEHMVDVAYRTDPEGRVAYMSPSCWNVFGFAQEEVVGRMIRDFYADPRQRDGFLNELAANGRTEDFRAQIRRKDGSLCWVSTNALVVHDGAGRVAGVEGVTRDITRLKESEDALRLAHERLRRHVDNAPLAVVEWDSDFRIVRWAGEAAKVFGWTADEVLGKRIDELPWVYEPDLPLVEGVVADMLSGRRPTNVSKNRNVRRDGTVIHCEWYNTSFRDDAGKLVSVLSQVLDVTERKTAEGALRSSLARVTFAEQAAHVGFWDWDIPTGKLEWSAEFYRLFGLDPEEGASFEAWRRVLPPQDRESAEARVERAIAERAPLENEYRILRADGERWIHVAGAAEYDEGGRALRMSGICTDVTDRRRMEESLQRERDQAQQYLDIAGVMIGALDPDGRVLMMNRRGRQLLGYEAEDLIGKNWFDLCLPAGLRDELRGVHAAVTEGSETVFGTHENRVVTKSGEERILSFRNTPVRDESGGVRGVLFSAEDVTDRKKAEERYQHLFTEMIDGFALHEILVDPGGTPVDYRFLAANPAFERLTGLRAGEIVGKTVRQVLPEIDPFFIETYGKVALTGEPARFEHEARPLGKHYDVTAYRPAPGQFVTIFADITELKRAQAEREDLENRFRQAQKMEAVGTLAGGIAHDFNNILTPIMAHGELAQMQLPVGDPVREDIAALLVAAERARDLVRQILIMTRREADGPMTSVLLAPLVKEVTKFLRASLPSTIEIRTEVDPACGPVLGDLSQLHQVLLNLCTNAGYAMQEKGGVLTVSLKPTHDRREGSWLSLSVRDTGPGIPQQLLGRVFEPYFTTKPVGKGSGLGLAVVHGIVTKLGGEVLVRSTVGEGTTFEVLLPETASAEPHPKTSPGEIPRGSGQHVLVVDDEAPIGAAVGRLLQSLGYRVTACTSGAEALASLQETPQAFHAVVTDYTMPGMTGLDLAGKMLAIRPDLPILLGTGFAEAVDAHVVAECGLRGLVMKPYDLRKLGQALHGVLGGKTEGT